MRAQLGLSDEQEAQLRKLHEDGRKAAIRRRADTAIARMELEEALGAATVDEKAVAVKLKAVTELQAAAAKARVDQRLAVRKLLTPEQYAKMKQLRQERRADRFSGRRGPGRGMRGRPGGPGVGQGGAPGGFGGPNALAGGLADEDLAEEEE
jgi:Spy/CpxP family protein refolding chaperone